MQTDRQLYIYRLLDTIERQRERQIERNDAEERNVPTTPSHIYPVLVSVSGLPHTVSLACCTEQTRTWYSASCCSLPLGLLLLTRKTLSNTIYRFFEINIQAKAGIHTTLNIFCCYKVGHCCISQYRLAFKRFWTKVN